MAGIVIDKFSTINKLMDFLSNHLKIPPDDISNIPYVYIDGSYNSETNTW